MRTTLDLPDDLVRRAKIAAVLRGTTLRQLVAEGLESVLGDDRTQKTLRTGFPILPSTEPGALTPDDVASILNED